MCYFHPSDGLGHLATVTDDQPLETLISKLSTQATWHGERLRGLDLFGKDRDLVDALSDPAIVVAGIRNRDICAHLKRARSGAEKQIGNAAASPPEYCACYVPTA